MGLFWFFACKDDICLGRSKTGKQNIYDCKASKSVVETGCPDQLVMGNGPSLAQL